MCAARVSNPLACVRSVDQDLQPVLSACPQLHTLKLSSCRCLRSDALHALFPSSATGQSGPLAAGVGSQPWGAVQQLSGESLCHSNCGSTAAASQGRALPMLTDLDVSYCPLSTEELADLLEHATGLQVSPACRCPDMMRLA